MKPSKDGANARAYEAYGGLVTLVLSEKLRGFPRQEIEDVASQLWVRLLSDDGRRLACFAGRSKFETWVSRVALNAAKDHLRRKRFDVDSLDAPWGDEDGESVYTLRDILGDPAPRPLEQLLARELRRVVASAVRGLPKRYREIVYARFYREWPAAQIARRFHIAEDTVYVRLSRAFRRLEKALAGYAGPERDLRGHVRPGKFLRWLDTSELSIHGTRRHGHLRHCQACRDDCSSLAALWLLLRWGGRARRQS